MAGEGESITESSSPPKASMTGRRRQTPRCPGRRAHFGRSDSPLATHHAPLVEATMRSRGPRRTPARRGRPDRTGTGDAPMNPLRTACSATLLLLGIGAGTPGRAGEGPKPMDPLSPAAQADVPQLVRGNNAFALDLYARLRTGEGNLFFSPSSLSTA